MRVSTLKTWELIWVRRSENYLIDPVNAAKLYKEYLAKQEKIYNERVQRANGMASLRQEKKE